MSDTDFITPITCTEAWTLSSEKKNTQIKGKQFWGLGVLTNISSYDTLFLMENPLIYDLSKKNVNGKWLKAFLQLGIFFETAVVKTISN